MTVTGLGLPPDASLAGPRLDDLLRSAASHAALVFVVALAVLYFAVLRGRRAPMPSPGATPPAPSRRARVATLALAGLVVFAVEAPLLHGNVSRAPEAPHALRIEVNARQWAFDTRLPGLDGTFLTDDDIIMQGELRVPAGVPVVIEVASSDVVHGLSLPHVRRKIDAIPGRLARTEFTALRAGRLPVLCSAFCGTAHGLMRGELIVLEPAEFDAWQQRASAAARVAARSRAPGTDWGWAWGGAGP